MSVRKLRVTLLLLLATVVTSCYKSTSPPLFVEGEGAFDGDNYFYKTVVIGDQEWMAENLRTSTFCNGDSIPYQGADIDVKMFNSSYSSVDTFGRFYNFEAFTDTSNLCPCNYRQPNDLDYAKLINYLGGFVDAMQKMKSSSNSGLWVEISPSYETDGNNASGFNALPTGIVFYDQSLYQDSLTRFWSLSNSSENAIYYGIGFNKYVSKQIMINSVAKQVNYYSVRCIKKL